MLYYNTALVSTNQNLPPFVIHTVERMLLLRLYNSTLYYTNSEQAGLDNLRTKFKKYLKDNNLKYKDL